MLGNYMQLPLWALMWKMENDLLLEDLEEEGFEMF